MVKYATRTTGKSAKVMGVALPVSFKQSVEVCRAIRGRPFRRALRLVQDVGEGKAFVPFRRFNRGGVGQRTDLGTARMPVKTCTQIAKLLQSARANAEAKGLDTSSLVVKAALAKKAAEQMHSGRHSRRRMKRTHIEIVLEEAEGAKKESLENATARAPKEKAFAAADAKGQKAVVQKEMKAVPTAEKGKILEEKETMASAVNKNEKGEEA